MKRLFVVAALMCASTVALAADALSVDSIAGVYKVSHTLTAVDAPSYTAEDVLEIVKVSPQRAYIRTRLYFTNGHQCSLLGVANLRGNMLTYSTRDDPTGDVCELSLRVENGRVVFHDKDNKCMQHNCGMRGSFEGIGFPLSSRREIRYLPRLLASREYKGALAVAGSTSAAPPAATGAPAVTPMHVKAPSLAFPRLSGLPNNAVQNKINAALAARETKARQDRKECIDEMRGSGPPGVPGDFHIVLDVTYVSARYVSLDIHNTYDCGGAYPTDDAPDPVTYDLTTGEEVKWANVFKPGFLLDDADIGSADATSRLFEMYAARYAKEGGRADPGCRKAVRDTPSSMMLWLDARKGLVVQPDYPHVMAACADQIAFTPAQLAPYIRDPKFLADLQATVRPTR